MVIPLSWHLVSQREFPLLIDTFSVLVLIQLKLQLRLGHGGYGLLLPLPLPEVWPGLVYLSNSPTHPMPEMPDLLARWRVYREALV